MIQWVQKTQMFIQHFWEACLTPYHFWMTLLGVTLTVCLWLKIKQRKRVLLVGATNQGRIEVAQGALEELVADTCKPFANRLKIRFNLKGNQVEIFLKLKLKAHLFLKTSALEIQDKLTAILKSHLSEEAVHQVHVCITGFTGDQVSAIDPLIKSLDAPNTIRPSDKNQIS